MPDASDLTYFEVVRTVFPVPSGVFNAEVKFEAQIKGGLVAQADIGMDIIEILTQPVYGSFRDGVLVKKDGTAGVELLSASGVAIDGGFSYLVTYSDAQVNGLPAVLAQQEFPALAGSGTFDLKDAGTFNGSALKPGSLQSRGPASFLSYGGINDDGDLVFVNNDSSSFAVSIPAGTLALVDNGDSTWTFISS